MKTEIISNFKVLRAYIFHETGIRLFVLAKPENLKSNTKSLTPVLQSNNSDIIFYFTVALKQNPGGLSFVLLCNVKVVLKRIRR